MEKNMGSKMTKSEISERLAQIAAFHRETRRLADELLERMESEGTLTDVAARIISQHAVGLSAGHGNLPDTAGTVEALEKIGFMENREEGECAVRPFIKTAQGGAIVTAVIKAQGGFPNAYVCSSDCQTAQACTAYAGALDDPGIELTLAEVKAGELAISDGKPEDNRDVDLYIYGDPHDEDFTERLTLRAEDIDEVLAEYGDPIT